MRAFLWSWPIRSWYRWSRVPPCVGNGTSDRGQYQIGMSLRILRDHISPVPATDYEQALDDFIGAVISGAPGVVVSNVDLRALWYEVVRERQKPELGDRRKLEAVLGYDPGAAPDPLLGALLKARDAYGADAVQEVAAASGDSAVMDLQSVAAGLENKGPIRPGAIPRPN